jgi:hypothetical protein
MERWGGWGGKGGRTVAVGVQVRVHCGDSAAGGQEVHLGWLPGIVAGGEDVEPS